MSIPTIVTSLVHAKLNAAVKDAAFTVADNTDVHAVYHAKARKEICNQEGISQAELDQLLKAPKSKDRVMDMLHQRVYNLITADVLAAFRKAVN